MLFRRQIQNLTRNGSSTALTIVRPVMRHLGWIPGQSVIVEVLDDDTLRVRLPRVEDFGPQSRNARALTIDPSEIAAHRPQRVRALPLEDAELAKDPR